MQEIQRSPRKPFSVTFAVDVADSDLMAMGLISAFSVLIPASLGQAVTISFYGSDAAGGPFLPIYLSDGSRAEIATQSGRIVVAPPELFSFTMLKATASVEFAAIILSKA